MSLKDSDTYELLDRFSYLLNLYAPLASELAEKLDKFGKYRKELQLIVVELKERGVDTQEPEELRSLIEEAIKKRDGETTDQTEGRGESGQDSGEPT
jgi:hypothetical protein